jgi:ketosteroid isomerase-like protein
MNPAIITASGEEVIARWKQRAVDREGRRFEGDLLAVYELREGKLARAQMFHFDTAAVLSFLENAKPG